MIRELGSVYRFILGAPASEHDVLNALVAHGIVGATVFPAVGFWQGEMEQSHVIELGGVTRAFAENFAEFLRARFEQTAVYFTDGRNAFLALKPATVDPEADPEAVTL